MIVFMYRVATLRMAEDKIKDELYEMSKPLARYADDEDLERMLKERERDGDPMLKFLKKKTPKLTPSGKPKKGRFTLHPLGLSSLPLCTPFIYSPLPSFPLSISSSLKIAQRGLLSRALSLPTGLESGRVIAGMGWHGPTGSRRHGSPERPTRKPLQTWHINGV